MRPLTLLVLLTAACNSDAPHSAPGDLAVADLPHFVHDLAFGPIDLGPKKCGDKLTCAAGEACVLCSPGFCLDGNCDFYACAALPTACESDRSCGCFDSHGGSTTECNLACGGGEPGCLDTPADPRWDFICGGM